VTTRFGVMKKQGGEMTRKTLLRSASALAAAFAAGHLMGHVGLQSRSDIAILAMKSFHFEMGGARRTYWDLFDGFDLIIIAVAFCVAALLLLLARVAEVAPRETRLVIVVIGALQIVFAMVGAVDFFWAPALINALAAACTLAAAFK
jgi:hypothetical protein